MDKVSEAAKKAKMVLDHPNISVKDVWELKSTKVTTDENTKVADGLCAWSCSSDDTETNESAARCGIHSHVIASGPLLGCAKGSTNSTPAEDESAKASPLTHDMDGSEGSHAFTS